MINCVICDKEERKDKAFIDSGWRKMRDKPVCRNCIKEIGQMLINEW